MSGDLDNPTEVTVIFTAPGLGSFTYLHLRLYSGEHLRLDSRPVGAILTPQLTDAPRVDDRSRFHPDRERAPVNTSGAFPATGGGGPVAGSGSPVAAGLLALAGAALLCAGASIGLMRRFG